MTRTLLTLNALAVVFGLLVVSVHFIPNHYCQAAFGLPCDVTQGR